MANRYAIPVTIGNINGNLIPSGDDTYDIGSATAAWQDLFLEGDVHLSDATTIAITAAAHDTAGPALIISAGDTTAGTTNNIAGGALTIQGGQGKGSGAGGDIIFQTANASGSGSSLNALATALTISDDLSSTFGGVVAVGDNARINMGAAPDAVIVHTAEAVGFDAEDSSGGALGSGVIVGSSQHLDVAANSLIISNVTTDGDIAFFVSDGGISKGVMTIKADKGNVEFYNTVYNVQTLDIFNKGTNGTANYLIIWNDVDGQIGSITHANDEATAYNTSSDYRRKENAVTLSGAVTRVRNLKPYRFNFKSHPDKTRDGFFAHEAATVVPEAVSGAKDAVDGDNNPIIQGMDNSKLVPLLTAAIQELDARITTLES